MRKSSSTRTAILVTAVVSTAFGAGIVLAYDALLDLAEDSITKATAQLQAAVVPNVSGQRCQKFVDKAVNHLDKSMLEIEKAKACAGA